MMLAQKRPFVDVKQKIMPRGPGVRSGRKFPLTGLLATTLLGFTPLATIAEPIKLVQWWDAYLPSKEQKTNYNYRSTTPYSMQYQDVNGDGVYNDALVWYEFSLENSLNPLSPGESENKPNQNYRTHLPSARFYGGMVARFTNVSHLTDEDRKGHRVPAFTRFQQATVQPTEGAKPCSYSSSYPHSTVRAKNDSWLSWADLTVMIVNEGGETSPFSQLFQDHPKAQVNFTATFLWKKADFLNGSAAADQITFDQTSQLSFDVTRFRKNIEEARFLVQDGDQLWISEGTTQAVVDEEGDTRWKGVAGVEVQELGKQRFGATVELNPLHSRWTLYQPAVEAESQERLETLEEMKYNPKKATSAAEQAYHDHSDKLLQAVNKMELNLHTATFVEHTFTDVQAVGVYFATYPFSHQTTQLVIDNFQAFGTANIPKVEAVVIPPQGDFRTLPSPPATQFTGGISVNGGPSEQQVKLCVCDPVTVRGNITVAPEDVGKPADLIVYAKSKLSPEDSQETFYMLTHQGGVQPWDQQPENLLPFQPQVTLLAHQPVEIYQGQFASPGFLQVFFGYRLPEGTVVTPANSIDILINSVNQADYNEFSYCENLGKSM
jgi:hypothetical protein